MIVQYVFDILTFAVIYHSFKIYNSLTCSNYLTRPTRVLQPHSSYFHLHLLAAMRCCWGKAMSKQVPKQFRSIEQLLCRWGFRLQRFQSSIM